MPAGGVGHPSSHDCASGSPQAPRGPRTQPGRGRCLTSPPLQAPMKPAMEASEAEGGGGGDLGTAPGSGRLCPTGDRDRRPCQRRRAGAVPVAPPRQAHRLAPVAHGGWSGSRVRETDDSPHRQSRAPASLPQQAGSLASAPNARSYDSRADAWDKAVAQPVNARPGEAASEGVVGSCARTWS